MKINRLALAALALAAAPATATMIVDTGTPTGGSGGWSLSSGQWLAAKFTAPTATLTDLTAFTEGSGSLHVALYTAPGNIPGTELFSAATSATATGFNGVHGVSCTVAAGDYFVAFEVRAGDTFVSDTPNPSPSPLAVEAFTNRGHYINYDPLNIGVRIDVGASAVPEPASWALLITGFGLSGVALRRRRAIVA